MNELLLGRKFVSRHSNVDFYNIKDVENSANFSFQLRKGSRGV